MLRRTRILDTKAEGIEAISVRELAQELAALS
jgi:hypothetical protein